jgi:hypothetical protein
MRGTPAANESGILPKQSPFLGGLTAEIHRLGRSQDNSMRSSKCKAHEAAEGSRRHARNPLIPCFITKTSFHKEALWPNEGYTLSMIQFRKAAPRSPHRITPNYGKLRLITPFLPRPPFGSATHLVAPICTVSH